MIKTNNEDKMKEDLLAIYAKFPRPETTKEQLDADMNAIKLYCGLGYSKKEALEVFTKIMSGK